MNRVNTYVLIAISVIIILIGLILYFNVFNADFSEASTDWANFAIFNGYFISVISIIILGYISIITYNTTDNFNRLQIKPLIFFILEITFVLNKRFYADK